MYRGGHATYGLFIGGTNIVVLCPAWFYLDVPVIPKSKRPCLDVDPKQNLFRGEGYSLAQSRRAWLLHELAHVYLVAATNKRVPVHEVYGVNSCFRLKADDQWYMPNNYVFYAGSMSPSFYLQYSLRHGASALELAITNTLLIYATKLILRIKVFTTNAPVSPPYRLPTGSFRPFHQTRPATPSERMVL